MNGLQEIQKERLHNVLSLLDRAIKKKNVKSLAYTIRLCDLERKKMVLDEYLVTQEQREKYEAEFYQKLNSILPEGWKI